MVAFGIALKKRTFTTGNFKPWWNIITRLIIIYELWWCGWKSFELCETHDGGGNIKKWKPISYARRAARSLIPSSYVCLISFSPSALTINYAWKMFAMWKCDIVVSRQCLMRVLELLTWKLKQGGVGQKLQNIFIAEFSFHHVSSINCNSQELGFIRLVKAYTTTSSLITKTLCSLVCERVCVSLETRLFETSYACSEKLHWSFQVLFSHFIYQDKRKKSWEKNFLILLRFPWNS